MFLLGVGVVFNLLNHGPYVASLVGGHLGHGHRLFLSHLAAQLPKSQKGLEVCYRLWGCHPDPRLGPILGPSRSHPWSEGVPSKLAICFVLQRFGPIQVPRWGPSRPLLVPSCSRAFLPGSGLDGPKQTSWPLPKISGFLKRAFAQTCLLAWYQVRCFRLIFWNSWGLVYGEWGRLWCRTSAQPESHFTCSSPNVPLGWYQVRCFGIFLRIPRGAGEGRGGALVRFLCKIQP